MKQQPDNVIAWIGLALVAVALLHGCARAARPKPTLDDWILCKDFCDSRGEMTLGLFERDEQLQCACVGMRPTAYPRPPIEAYRVRPPLLGPDPARPRASSRRTT